MKNNYSGFILKGTCFFRFLVDFNIKARARNAAKLVEALRGKSCCVAKSSFGEKPFFLQYCASKNF